MEISEEQKKYVEQCNKLLDTMNNLCDHYDDDVVSAVWCRGHVQNGIKRGFGIEGLNSISTIIYSAELLLNLGGENGKR